MTEYSSKKFMGVGSVAIGEIKEFFGDYPPLLEIDNMTFIKDGHVATAGFDESLNEYANNGINWVIPELKTGFRSSTGLFHGFADSQQPIVYAGDGVWFGVLNRVNRTGKFGGGFV